jgi:3-methylcrotonyl-CoA carboxylase alpha subunit
MKVRFQFLGAPVEADVVREEDRLLVGVAGGRGFAFRIESGALVVERGGAVRRLPFARVKDRRYLHLDGKVWEFAQAEPGFAAKAGTEKFDGKVCPPMPGNVVKVMVAAGDTVEKGAPLVIIESMKMEHTVEAPEAGKVLEVRATAGTVADLTAPMIVMEIAPAGEGAK